jgi:hypothetical protein
MNYNYTNKSIVEKRNNDLVEIPRSISVATRMIEMGSSATLLSGSTGSVIMLPLYNLFNIQ